MTGVNASKIIQNLEILNSFCLSSLAFFLFWFFHFAIWVRCIPPTPRPWRGGGGQKLPSPLQHSLVLVLELGPLMFAGLVDGSFASLQ